MTELTTHERVRRMFEHRDADRVPITDWIWESTIQRWVREGLVASEATFEDALGMDRIEWISEYQVDTSPRFPKYTIEETDSYKIEHNEWGVTTKNFKPVNSTPQDLAFEITGPDTWRQAAERMTPTRDRVNWAHLQKHYRRWRSQGYWITASPWFGFDVSATRMCGTERIMLAMAQEPEWCREMWDAMLNLTLSLLEMIWDEGYTFDELMWFDDMAYNKGLFFSPAMYRRLVRPYQQRVVDWCHERGIKAHLHCCGNMKALLPDIVAMGVDALHPLEVKAGMDPAQVKREFGNDLVLHGGFDVQNWSDIEKAEAEIRGRLPIMKENGGYIFSCDHSIPDNVSLRDYQRIVQLAKEVGAY